MARGRTRSSREDLFAHWPESGRLEMAHVVMRYRAGLRPVLAGVSLTVEAGQKVSPQRSPMHGAYPLAK